MPDDKKERAGKNHLGSLQPGFLWEMGLVVTHGDTKYARYNWKDGHPQDYCDALLRHVLKYSAGETYDIETGLHHAAFVATNAMYLHWHDCGDVLPTRTCYCPHCQRKSGHCTYTLLGG